MRVIGKGKTAEADYSGSMDFLMVTRGVCL